MCQYEGDPAGGERWVRPAALPRRRSGGSAWFMIIGIGRFSHRRVGTYWLKLERLERGGARQVV